MYVSSRIARERYIFLCHATTGQAAPREHVCCTHKVAPHSTAGTGFACEGTVQRRTICVSERPQKHGGSRYVCQLPSLLNYVNGVSQTKLTKLSNFRKVWSCFYQIPRHARWVMRCQRAGRVYTCVIDKTTSNLGIPHEKIWRPHTTHVANRLFFPTGVRHISRGAPNVGLSGPVRHSRA